MSDLYHGEYPVDMTPREAADEIERKAKLIERRHNAPQIPAGMVPWAGGDSAPADWDGGPVLSRSHGLRRPDELNNGRWHRRRSHAFFRDIEEGCDIIAYTPALSTPTTPEEGEALERLFAQAFNDGIAAGKSGDEELLAGSASAYAQAAMLAFRPSEGEGLREAAIKGALCLSGFAGLGIFVEGFEDPADAYGTLVDALGMPDADDDDLRAALNAKGER